MGSEMISYQLLYKMIHFYYTFSFRLCKVCRQYNPYSGKIGAWTSVHEAYLPAPIGLFVHHQTADSHLLAATSQYKVCYGHPSSKNMIQNEFGSSILCDIEL